MLRRSLLISSATLAAAFFSNPKGFSFTPPAPKDWMNWRGPNREGIVTDTNWNESLDPQELTSRWKQTLGDSYSGPIILGDTIFTTESQKGLERVHAFELATGKTRWSRDWEGKHSVPFFAAKNGSWIRSTPATDGKRLFVGGIRDVLVALDCESGAEVWRVDFAAKTGKVPDFGMVCSPLVDGDHLYVQAGSAVHKLACDDGSIVWTGMQGSNDMMSGGAFSSPVIQTLNGTRQLVVQSRTQLGGLDLTTGNVLWMHEVAAFRGMNILTPTIWDNAIFTSSYGGRSLLVNVSGDGKTDVRWQNKVEGYMSSPIVIDHFVYLHLRNKRFTCIDLQSGEEKWVTQPFGEYWSMVSNGKRILALDQTGTLRLIAHNPSKFEQISERRISEEETWAHIAVSDHLIAIRSQKALEVFDWK
jgi:outer membrane protein assembly factor BamB